MAGLDPELNRQLMATLRRCEAFTSNAELRTVFVDARLSPWAYNVPEAGSTYSRVQATIAFLHDKTNVQGENALVLFLQAIQERYDPEDAFYGELGSLIAALGGGVPAQRVASASMPTQSMGGNIDYDAGVSTLLARLGPTHPRYNEALVYQQRLNENQSKSRIFGDTETRRAERAEIIMQFNSLSLATLNIAFNELAGISPPTGGQPSVSPAASGDITIAGDGNVIGSFNRVSVNKSTATASGSPSVAGGASSLPDRTAVVKLLGILTQRFSSDEFQNLCFALGVKYDDLPAGSLSGKARELISYCERHNCIPQLIETGKTLRTDIDWE